MPEPPQDLSRTPSRTLAVRRCLRELGCETYFDYLRTPHWRRLGRKYRASSLPQACICGETNVELHHRTYERLGAEEISDLFPLCTKCHAMVHVFVRRGLIDVGVDPNLFKDDAQAALYAVDLQAAARRAAEEFASPQKLLATDMASLRAVGTKTRDQRQVLRHLRMRRRRLKPPMKPRHDALATDEDLKRRVYDP